MGLRAHNQREQGGTREEGVGLEKSLNYKALLIDFVYQLVGLQDGARGEE